MTTKEEYMEALEKSIKHWEDVAEDPLNTNIKAADCALCRLVKVTCGECPIKWCSGDWLCNGTPYDKFASFRKKLKTSTEFPTPSQLTRAAKLAAKEVEFLDTDVRQAVEDHFKPKFTEEQVEVFDRIETICGYHVRKNAEKYTIENQGDDSELGGMFIWSNTDEGLHFWNLVNRMLELGVDEFIKRKEATK